MKPRARNALIGGLFFSLAAVLVLVAAVHRGESERLLGFSVRSCIEAPSDCRSRPLIRLRGAYVPGSQTWSTGECPSELELQSPGGEPPGRIHVCSQQVRTPSLDALSSTPVAEFLRRGFLLVEATGHFDGARLKASQVTPVKTNDVGFYQATFGELSDAGRQ